MKRIRARSAIILGLWLILGVPAARGECLDLRSQAPVTFAGTLSFQIFGGPPYNGGVAKGDTPEPTYILKLDQPVCVQGDDFLEAGATIDRVQVYPDFDLGRTAAMLAKMRGLVGARVVVQGKSPFGAHTGHHHAPLMLPISTIDRDSDPTEAYGTAKTTVQGFYLALAAGSGEQAVRFIVPEKRRSGPFSADAITKFYGSLDEPLTLSDVTAAGPNVYRVRYTFVARGKKRCDGEALVQTVRVGDENLISSIKALSGC